MNQAALSDSYDELPYNCKAHLSSQPSHLWAVGKLFDLEVKDYKSCSVLELGCANGGNIMTAAAAYPEASFTGIDYSRAQIEHGNKIIDEADLGNIQLICQSIEDIGPDFGTFDYIIAHGLLSWVPEGLQQKIFDICQNNLADDGLAYISFNAYPGWHFGDAIRHMMHLHLANQTNQPRIFQARKARDFVKFLSDNLQPDQSHFQSLLKQEYDLLAEQSLSYIAHDHLEENNHPFYFSEVVRMAEARGLHYVIDANIATVYEGNYSPSARTFFCQPSVGLIEKEQYMDMLMNRRFRQIILSKKKSEGPRTMNPAFLRHLAFTTTTREAGNEGVADGIKVYTDGSRSFRIQGEDSIAIMTVLIQQNGYPIDFDTLVNKTSAIQQRPKEQIENALLKMAYQMIQLGTWTFMADPGQFVTFISDKPQVCPVVRAMLTNNNWFNNRLYSALEIQSHEAQFIKYIDGTRDFPKLVQDAVSGIRTGALELSKNGHSLSTSNQLEKEVAAIWEQILKACAQQAMLVA